MSNWVPQFFIFSMLLKLCFANNINHKYVRTFRDKRYSLYTYLKLSNVNELQCTLACSNDEECGSINHQKDENLCELNQLMETEHQREDLKTDKGWNHFIKSKAKPVPVYSDSIYIPDGKRNLFFIFPVTREWISLYQTPTAGRFFKFEKNLSV